MILTKALTEPNSVTEKDHIISHFCKNSSGLYFGGNFLVIIS